MKHDHKECEHKGLAFCKKCDVIYCLKCGKEWIQPISFSTTYTSTGSSDIDNYYSTISAFNSHNKCQS